MRPAGLIRLWRTPPIFARVSCLVGRVMLDREPPTGKGRHLKSHHPPSTEGGGTLGQQQGLPAVPDARWEVRVVWGCH